MRIVKVIIGLFSIFISIYLILMVVKDVISNIKANLPIFPSTLALFFLPILGFFFLFRILLFGDNLDTFSLRILRIFIGIILLSLSFYGFYFWIESEVEFPRLLIFLSFPLFFLIFGLFFLFGRRFSFFSLLSIFFGLIALNVGLGSFYSIFLLKNPIMPGDFEDLYGLPLLFIGILTVLPLKFYKMVFIQKIGYFLFWLWILIFLFDIGYLGFTFWKSLSLWEYSFFGVVVLFGFFWRWTLELSAGFFCLPFLHTKLKKLVQ